jgi:acetyl-CoA carboxylase carboxyltransferase component
VVAGLHCTTFARLAALAGRVPLIGMVGGRCFAGNAALLGCCDLIVAAEGSSIGMGGPAMIEGGGLGRVAADDVGPAAMHAAAGSVDLLVADDGAVLAAARRLLGLWRPSDPTREMNGTAAAGGDPTALREAVPASRQAVFDPLAILATVCDADSVLELGAGHGRSLVTAFGRLGGQAVALVASQPRHLGGALDAAACDKLARFMQLAQARGLPLLQFIDTPGFMVGPQAEQAGLVRRAGRVFVAAAALTVPVLAVVLRRGYGLGAMALAGGHFHVPVAIAAWPGAEFGAMGIEGAVKLGWRKELAAAAERSEAERAALQQQLTAQLLAHGQALNMAAHLEIDAVIDPADTRAWLLRGLRAAGQGRSTPR